jgi:hypothetical protein
MYKTKIAISFLVFAFGIINAQVDSLKMNSIYEHVQNSTMAQEH